ncbi:FadR/GntR family transcriptional regulator [Allosediminivita pacifica]|uniref:GntR family transcriptional regulator n=1 Tax=Allosediminivita pacifica TaxID=1267769 RepID=A0A2T6A8Y3_9RHOB|nr:FadR/GntR family transcriptional regulator [Allosediminivita pacifica]PTX40288.1 GntR family transcriptional regulator [Allosediminivita pacifica]GGB26558.1 GntR family transcriptional regulator [Allosediminivita pacifica]
MTISNGLEPLGEETGVRSSALAQALKDKIVKGELKVGSSLPSERELMVQFSVSRATIREALRALGAQGLIEVRRGRRGGSFICAPSHAQLSDSIDLFIAGHDIRFVDLLAVREAIEPVAAAQAALCRTDEQVETLDRIHRDFAGSIDDLAMFSSLNVDWHLAIVEASGNPLFLTVMRSISSALYSATKREEFVRPVREIVVKSHQRINDAIRDRDLEGAQRRMLRHVTSYKEKLDFTAEHQQLGISE